MILFLIQILLIVITAASESCFWQCWSWVTHRVFGSLLMLTGHSQSTSKYSASAVMISLFEICWVFSLHISFHCYADDLQLYLPQILEMFTLYEGSVTEYFKSQNWSFSRLHNIFCLSLSWDLEGQSGLRLSF